jgi:acyl-CoA synthetase (AMP-forming)/AMP-acid ligase II
VVAALVITAVPIDEIVAGVRARLSSFKVPTRWLLADDATAVPVSGTGKVDKPGLQQLLREQGSAAPR